MKKAKEARRDNDTWVAGTLLSWYQTHGRKDLPWRTRTTPYRVWVSEIMLQQTQVTTVIPYFERFLERFPDIESLAAGDRDEVLHLWAGLGYYARARNLHRAAQLANGSLPDTSAGLMALPGIGRSTAAAILAIGFGQRAVILDANVKRVVTRLHALRGDSASERSLWQHADAHTPAERAGDYAQAIMDFGATHCRRSSPLCPACPLSDRCLARERNLQHVLPEPRRKRPLPVRAVHVLLLVDAEGAVLLERRPDGGVWGGLWSPPELPGKADVAAMGREWGGRIDGVETLPAVRHSFTHLHLDITPHLMRTGRRADILSDSDRHVWFAPNDERRLGLSAVAVRLLAGIHA
ncbi:MAG: A/G-specific adenine glycosylase [Gammaproteobacteria bacterium]|nr:A/G-specific adenine glycosylase [Gammaproteobacteria bacterium]